MCDECGEETTGPKPERFSMTDVAVVGLRWLGNIFGTTGSAIHALADLGMRHDVWQRQREEWAASAGREIEMLTDPDR